MEADLVKSCIINFFHFKTIRDRDGWSAATIINVQRFFINLC